MVDSEDFSGLMSAKIKLLCQDICEEKIKPVRDSIEEVKRNINDIQKYAIGLLITILLAVVGYLGAKVMDNMLDKNISNNVKSIRMEQEK
jgi:hypothetical protein